MLLSSSVIWRHRDWETFRLECPAGDEPLQRLVWEGLDDAIRWLETIGAPVAWGSTGNPRTVGKRFEPSGLTRLLASRAGEVSLGTCGRMPTPSTQATILCTGGFQGDPELVEDHISPAGPLRLRANPWSTGDGLRAAQERGAATSAGMDEFYGRNMPDADFGEADFIPQAQLYGRFAHVLNERGEPFFDGDVSWSENDLVQATARQPNARAWYLLDDDALSQHVRERSVADMVAAAPDETKADPAALPFGVPRATRIAVRVSPGITHTIGGLRVDTRAHVLRADETPIEGLFAAGADVGGISTGGYASGLAAGLVLGLAAAESAASEAGSD